MDGRGILTPGKEGLAVPEGREGRKLPAWLPGREKSGRALPDGRLPGRLAWLGLPP